MNPPEGYEHPQVGEIVQADWKTRWGTKQWGNRRDDQIWREVDANHLGYSIELPEMWAKPKQEPTK